MEFSFSFFDNEEISSSVMKLPQNIDLIKPNVFLNPFEYVHYIPHNKHEDFKNYLKLKYLYLDVWNGKLENTKSQIGKARLTLKNFFRSVQKTPEFFDIDIVDPVFLTKLGSLQILVKLFNASESHIGALPINQKLKTKINSKRSTNSYNTSSDFKKKNIINNYMYKTLIGEKKELSPLRFSKQEQVLFTKVIEDMQLQKELNKNENLKNAINRNLSKSQIYKTIQIGVAEVIVLPFKNNELTNQQIFIEISGDCGRISWINSDFSLVTEAKEASYWAKKELLKSDSPIIGSNNINVESKFSAVFLIKHHCYIFPLDKNRKNKYEILFRNQEDKILSIHELHLTFENPLIDRHLYLNELENQESTINLPLYQKEESSILNENSIYATYEKCKIEQIDKENIRLLIKVPFVNNTINFYLYLYNNQYKNKLQEIIKIHLRSYSG